jgi:hypothetical protein
VSYIGQLRTNTAKYTDERVRLAGEAIAGCLAVKMLGEGHYQWKYSSHCHWKFHAACLLHARSRKHWPCLVQGVVLELT